MAGTAEYDRLFAEIDEAYRSGNAERAAALVTLDAVISPIDLSDIATRKDIERTLKQFFASARIDEYRLVVGEADTCDGTAHVWGTFRWRTSHGDGTTTKAEGRYSAVLKQTREGWRLHRFIENRLPSQAVPFSAFVVVAPTASAGSNPARSDEEEQ
jgi:ketosteroid isomerase-like protein